MKSIFKIIIIIITLIFMNSCVTNDRNLNEGIITVYGIGEITFTPDVLNLRIEIKNVDSNLIAAGNKTKSTITEFINICNSFSIIDENIHTSNISTGREYKYNSVIRENEFVGFYSSVTILISVNIFSKFEDLSGLLLQFDDLSISNLRFTHSNIEELESNVNLLALDNAKLNAEKMVEHIGLRLGKIIDISYIIDRDPFTGGLRYNDVEGNGRSTGGIPVSPGIMTLSRRVQVKYKIY